MKNKSIYIFELILLAFIVILKILFIDKLSQFYDTAVAIFWAISAFVLYKSYGLKKNKTMVASNSVQITIIITMLYFLLTYLSGLALGFLRNGYSLTITNIISNIWYLIIMIVSEELVRSMIVKKCMKDNKPIYVLTLLYILLDIVLIFNVNAVNTGLKLFIFVCDSVLPIIAINMLCTYFAKSIGHVPGLIYRLVISIYIYIIPIFPDLGYYVSSVLGILVPYLIYMFTSKMISDSEKKRISPLKKNVWYVNIPLVIVIVFVVGLVSGLFRYQIMAIGSGSMEPVIYRGDAVIFEKVKDEYKDKIEKGEVLVFKHNGKYITHRIVDRYINKDGITVYQTKGDNNNTNDDFVIVPDEIVGVTKMKISYIGFPSLWVQDLFNK